MFVTPFAKHIHQLRVKAGKMETVKWLQSRARCSVRDDGIEVVVLRLECRDRASWGGKNEGPVLTW